MIVFFIARAVAMAHVGIAEFVIKPSKNHRSAWTGFGSRGIFIGGDAANAFPIGRFIIFRGHLALQDSKLDAICRVDIALQALFLAAICSLAKPI